MKLRVREIVREGVIEVEETIPAARFPLDTPDQPQLLAPVRVKMRAEIQDGVPWAWVQAEVELSIACARCLERYTFRMGPSFDVEGTLQQDYLEVDDDIRQNILLALPPQPLCRPDCRGLCVTCGRNRNEGACRCPSQAQTSAFDVLRNLKIK